MSEPADVTATFCATFTDELVRAGVRHAVVCPGSRSTPMALALAADDRVALHVHTDERAAAFVALGIGLATGVPAVVLTTSGTAAVELHPAVVEAHHAKVPLVALTADRPAELHGVGAPQTIDQAHLYGPAVRAYHEPGVPDAASRGDWRRVAARVVADASGPPAGPVQCNLAFREPLLGTPGALPDGRALGAPWLGRTAPASLDPDAVAAVADGVAGRRGLIVAGGGITQPDEVLELAESLGWPVLADARSGCRQPVAHVIAHFDALLRDARFAAAARPEVVVRLGGLPASRVLGEWLAGLDAWQIGVEADGDVVDPWGSLACVMAGEPGRWAGALRSALADADPTVRAPTSWASLWAQADAEAGSAVAAELRRQVGPTEPAVARAVLAAVPDGGRLVVSSSLPVRDLEWYATPRDEVVVHANRGANGIDGVVSTAVGVALGASVPTVALVGDLAFLHDTNALLGVVDRAIDLTVVVVDNDGGGIFEHLPQATVLDRATFDLLFGTPHGLDLVAVGAAYGVAAQALDDVADLGAAVGTGDGVRLLHVSTDRVASARVRDALHAAVADAVGRMLDGRG